MSIGERIGLYIVIGALFAEGCLAIGALGIHAIVVVIKAVAVLPDGILWYVGGLGGIMGFVAAIISNKTYENVKVEPKDD